MLKGDSHNKNIEDDGKAKNPTIIGYMNMSINAKETESTVAGLSLCVEWWSQAGPV